MGSRTDCLRSGLVGYWGRICLFRRKKPQLSRMVQAVLLNLGVPDRRHPKLPCLAALDAVLPLRED